MAVTKCRSEPNQLQPGKARFHAGPPPWSLNGPRFTNANFKQVQVDPEAGAIVWPNGVDFCPDVLYAFATGKPVKSLEPV